MNSPDRDEAQIEAETTLSNFGLFMTVEDNDVMVPTSRIYSVFRIGGASAVQKK